MVACLALAGCRQKKPEGGRPVCLASWWRRGLAGGGEAWAAYPSPWQEGVWRVGSPEVRRPAVTEKLKPKLRLTSVKSLGAFSPTDPKPVRSSQLKAGSEMLQLENILISQTRKTGGRREEGGETGMPPSLLSQRGSPQASGGAGGRRRRL